MRKAGSFRGCRNNEGDGTMTPEQIGDALYREIKMQIAVSVDGYCLWEGTLPTIIKAIREAAALASDTKTKE
jgi:hypothetical protein